MRVKLVSATDRNQQLAATRDDDRRRNPSAAASERLWTEQLLLERRRFDNVIVGCIVDYNDGERLRHWPHEGGTIRRKPVGATSTLISALTTGPSIEPIPPPSPSVLPAPPASLQMNDLQSRHLVDVPRQVFARTLFDFHQIVNFKPELNIYDYF